MPATQWSGKKEEKENRTLTSKIILFSYQLPELQRPLLSCWRGGGRIRVALLESEQELRPVLALDHLERKKIQLFEK